MRKRHLLGLLGLSLLLAAPAAAQGPKPVPTKKPGADAQRERPAKQQGPRRQATPAGRKQGSPAGVARGGQPSLRRVILQRWDANKNGKLDPAELQRLGREVNAGPLGKGGAKPVGQGPQARRKPQGGAKGTPPTTRGKAGVGKNRPPVEKGGAKKGQDAKKGAKAGPGKRGTPPPATGKKTQGRKGGSAF